MESSRGWRPRCQVTPFINSGIEISPALPARTLKVTAPCRAPGVSSRREPNCWEIMGLSALDSGKVMVSLLGEYSSNLMGHQASLFLPLLPHQASSGSWAHLEISGAFQQEGRWEEGYLGLREGEVSLWVSIWVGSEILKAHSLLIHLLYFNINSVNSFRRRKKEDTS